jgi:hypothetical protein
MKTIKTILIVFALVLTMSLTGSASNVSLNEKSQTENSIVSSTNSSATVNSGKAKKATHKHHKSASGSKKTK